MSKYFRPWNIDQTLLLPPNVQDFVPKGHVSRFIVELVRESLDLQEITGSYVSGLGQPPFDPRMMVALLLHGYASGLYSSRRIGPAASRNDWRRCSRGWRRWRPTPGWRRRKSVASRPKRNSSAKPKAARSRANRRRRHRTNLIPSRNATSPIRKAAS